MNYVGSPGSAPDDDRADGQASRDFVAPADQADYVPTTPPPKTAVELRQELCGLRERATVIDDGTLTARLHNEPGLADALLGRALLHPAELPSEVDYSAAQASLVKSINQALAVALAPLGLLPLGTPIPDATPQAIPTTGLDLAALDLAATVDLLVALQQRCNALNAAQALLLEHARRTGFREEADFIDDARMIRIGAKSDRQELVQRAVIADVAMALHDGHDEVAKRMAQGQSLVARAPQTLAATVAGKVGWRNAAFLADQVADLAPSIAAKVDAACCARAETATPALFRRKVRKVIEEVHPIPMEVRHAEAACKRHVRTEPAADGMGYLTLFAPVVAINAIWDRLSQTAKRVRYGSGYSGSAPTDARTHRNNPVRQIQDSRTLEQLRADTAIALLLDDGTLDLATAAFDTSAEIRARDLPDDAATEHDPRVGDRSGRRIQASDVPFSLARVARSIRPKVFVTVPVLTLLDAADAPALLDGTIPIDADTARELAGLATSFTRILTDPYHGNVLGVDAKNYRPPAGLRQWVQLRDATCRFPGCTRRAVESDVDHNAEWSQGGATAPSNLAALCRRHHSLKTIGAFKARSGAPTTDPASTDTAYANTTATTEAAPSSSVVSRKTLRSEDPSSASLVWTGPTGRQEITTADPVPTTIHRPGTPLPRGLMPDASEAEASGSGAPVSDATVSDATRSGTIFVGARVYGAPVYGASDYGNQGSDNSVAENAMDENAMDDKYAYLGPPPF